MEPLFIRRNRHVEVRDLNPESVVTETFRLTLETLETLELLEPTPFSGLN